MKALSVLLALFTIQILATPALAQLSCESDMTNLVAHYQIDVKHGNNATRATTMNLWRNSNKVAHEYPATHITESWTHVRNKLIKPTRFFDAHARAIEYQPGETIHGKRENDFSYRYQLISDTMLGNMTLIETEEKGCNTIQYYSLKQGQTAYSLTWLPNQKLIKQFSVHNANSSRTWTLQEVDYERSTSDFFAKREAYQTTDYADIGDDHTDPFLTKMVNQGFIEAGASGYYDTDGHAIGEAHTH
ncbi:hypothetical protein D210916BOD24_10660 [Alteromonas sp. D210916BOD_24]|uniref:hypothetical protein n=1 Tax=Alteromonas sp. D210916BOD_24 TaxID=3157618 RepID=UPI00399C951A